VWDLERELQEKFDLGAALEEIEDIEEVIDSLKENPRTIMVEGVEADLYSTVVTEALLRRIRGIKETLEYEQETDRQVRRTRERRRLKTMNDRDLARELEMLRAKLTRHEEIGHTRAARGNRIYEPSPKALWEMEKLKLLEEEIERRRNER
jgi:hypothetical protein